MGLVWMVVWWIDVLVVGLCGVRLVWRVLLFGYGVVMVDCLLVLVLWIAL